MVLFLFSILARPVTVVDAKELHPESDFKQNSDPYLPNVVTSIAECSLRHYKWGDNEWSAPVAGTKTFLREFPHMTAVGWTKNDTVHWNCGGSLVTESFVLTAAHCTFWEGARPDVVRLGDLNLKSDYDDKYAQQRIIDDVIRHPNYKISSTYDDIALLHLKTPIIVHDTVMPACLWPTFDFNFEEMEAAGWGLTSRNGEKAERLLKVRLHAVSNEECNESYTKSRKLREGLVSSQICANSKGEVRQDTCAGDSGGSLEIKLYGRAKLIPFLVGVTSFGIGCGSGSPGVYTRVSTYMDWITTTVNETFDPIKCAMRNIQLRLFEPSFYLSKEIQYDDGTGNFEFKSINVDNTKFFVKESRIEYRVSLTNQKDKSNITCGGSIIDELFILTSASCVSEIPDGPNTVNWMDDGKLLKIDVEKVFIHENYDKMYDDIALIKLQQKIQFNKNGQFACPWSSNEMPTRFDAYGFGPTNINLYGNSFNIQYLTIKSNPVPSVNCTDKISKIFNLTHGVMDTQMCVGNSLFLVPNSCEIDEGGPLQRLVYDNTRFFPFLFGINSIGVDCGFGIPLVTTKVSSYISWIDSIMYADVVPEKTENKEVKVNFAECINQNLHLRQGVGEYKHDRYYQNTQTFVSSVAFVGHFSKEAKSWTPEWGCDGAIIHAKFIITTARCASPKKERVIKVLIGIKSHRQMMDTSRSYIHSSYNSETGDNDIAMLETSGYMKFDEFTSPACLWYNQTHLPLFMKKVLVANFSDLNLETIDRNVVDGLKIFPITNEDCAEYHDSLSTKHFCTFGELGCKYASGALNGTLCSTENCPNNHGEIVLSFEMAHDKVTPVLVGLASAKNYCNVDKMLVFTRISAYKYWIETMLNFSDEFLVFH